MPLYGIPARPTFPFAKPGAKPPSSLAASPDGPWNFTHQPWRLACDWLNLMCECRRSSIAYEHDCERREVLLAHKLLAVANTMARCVAPAIVRCSTRATWRTKPRASNRCWMKVQWQVKAAKRLKGLMVDLGWTPVRSRHVTVVAEPHGCGICSDEGLAKRSNRGLGAWHHRMVTCRGNKPGSSNFTG